jgi:hypothetical protein
MLRSTITIPHGKTAPRQSVARTTSGLAQPHSAMAMIAAALNTNRIMRRPF